MGPMPALSNNSCRAKIWTEQFSVRWRLWDRCRRKIDTGFSRLSSALTQELSPLSSGERGMTGRELRYWESEYHGGSAEEPQKNHRKREGDLCQCDEQVSYHGTTILLTATPKDHDWHLDKMSLLDIYT